MSHQSTKTINQDVSNAATLDPAPTTAQPARPSELEIPDYQMLRPIGQGGFSEVWLARNRHDRQYYAVKLIRPDRESELDGVRLYRRCTSHPGLLPLLHVGWASTRYYIVMPLADSATGSGLILDPDEYEPMTLERWQRRRGRLQFDEIVTLGESLLGAVDHLHEAGLVHGDIKPGNVLSIENNWRLADFGSVCRGGSADVRGYTPEYSPPEGGGSRSADLYAIGIVLCEMISGVHPSRLDSPESPIADTCNPDCRIRQFGQIVRQALNPDPVQRFFSAHEMWHGLRSCLDGRAALTAPRVPAAEPGPFRQMDHDHGPGRRTPRWWGVNDTRRRAS